MAAYPFTAHLRNKNYQTFNETYYKRMYNDNTITLNPPKKIVRALG